MKKFAAVLLAALFCVASFAACAQSGGSEAAESSAQAAQAPESSAPEESAESAEGSDTVGVTAEPASYAVASLKGPTTMGMVKLMQDAENGETFNTYLSLIHI